VVVFEGFDVGFTADLASRVACECLVSECLALSSGERGAVGGLVRPGFALVLVASALVGGEVAAWAACGDAVGHDVGPWWCGAGQ
jgi:hypothetical protein